MTGLSSCATSREIPKAFLDNRKFLRLFSATVLVSPHCFELNSQRTYCLTSILERLASGDESAAEECIFRYGGLVWRLSKRYLDAAQGEIEDAVQDIFVEVWLHANRYDPEKGSEAAFIATIAHRRLTDRQRRLGAQRRSTSGYAKELQILANQERASGEEQIKNASYNKVHELLEAGFHELPEVERNALWLAVYRGLSHREISEATDAPVGTVKSRLRRAMSRLSVKVRSGSPIDPAEKGELS